MLEIKYHPKALAEAFKTAEYYDRQQKGLGLQFFEELDATVARMCTDPMRAKADIDGVRSWRFRRFPFRIHYVLDPNRIRILAVADLRRRPKYWQERVDE